MIDPRELAISAKLEGVKRIIPVVSGKGGVGKSLISTTLALVLSEQKYKVGLLDLDFHGASDHVILGFEPKELPEEDKGVIPPTVHGIKFMTIAYYTEDRPTPLRGKEISDALIELLTITRWDELDFLVVDMPPGMGDQFLDVLKYFKRGEFLIVATPSKLSLNVVRKLIELLKEEKHQILGIVENMKLDEEEDVMRIAQEYGIRYLGGIPLYRDLESKVGNVNELLATEFAEKIRGIAKKI
ncbi:ATP-binding protein [Pyrococcus furiosus DSM 3638]|uniref:Iron-sulfur cluster carrier protein n=3 Tax=Pyrococcus furiosus TaxID=2261 RepID=A0A5C0XNT5_PYRFU|nr:MULTISPECIES: Mrp/NBP35 family ATP-binding protein [Pyrococcus]AAL80740.1 nucleotide-binding protein (mrp/nbp35 family) [Pyrococcus furiosus DSM 3638]AFN03409.1 Mrp/NBP35 family nucleotide-binding protein [Pyrococcus furiosus COM1]MDK2869629.1 ATP-binding protein involved in chromosome partitioning [Pyrococcus sp.]QEK78321.1 ATP-binding protein [Pyrococcus furiosus DSM 3638]